MVQYQNKDGVWLVRADNPPVNALSKPVREGLLRGLESGEDDASVDIVAIVCDGRSYFAGADVRELEQGLEEPGLLELIQLSESMSKPVITVMQRHAYGGGIVVALACDYRVALPGTRFAMPEVSLGLLPTFGGTQYLPRLVGLPAAAELILGQVVFDETDALRCGLIDRVATADSVIEEVQLLARDLRQNGAGKRSVKNLERDNTTAGATESVLAEYQRCLVDCREPLELPAREASLNLLARSTEPNLEANLKQEHAIFLNLLGSPESATLRRRFFQSRER